MELSTELLDHELLANKDMYVTHIVLIAAMEEVDGFDHVSNWAMPWGRNCKQVSLREAISAYNCKMKTQRWSSSAQ